MKLQVLISAVNRQAKELIETMNLATDGIIINQCDRHGYQKINIDDKVVEVYDFAERGVGLSRNNALLRADADIVLFSDEDISYVDGYEKLVLDAFDANKDADMLVFNFDVCQERRTYWITKKTRVRTFNSGRYPTYSFAIRLSKLRKSRVMYSLLFGGGAKYSCGEDSLFIRDLIRSGFRVYALPICIGREIERESSWFSGYNEKFFFDKGVLFHFLYGALAPVMVRLFIWKKRKFMFGDVSKKKAYELMMAGIKEAKC